MSIIEEVLLEEHERSSRVSNALKAELAKLPRGSIRERVIKGHSYYYLQYREGEHVRSDYVSRENIDELRAQIARRKEIIAALKEQEQSRKQIERVLRRDCADVDAGA